MICTLCESVITGSQKVAIFLVKGDTLRCYKASNISICDDCTNKKGLILTDPMWVHQVKTLVNEIVNDPYE